MIGIVIVSHSFHLGAEVIKIALDMSSPTQLKFPLINASGNKDKSLGTDPMRIFSCIKEANRGKGVIILCDLGSSVQNSIEAIELLEGEERKDVFIADAPLVEGVIVAASANSGNTDLATLLMEIEEVKTFPKVKRR